MPEAGKHYFVLIINKYVYTHGLILKVTWKPEDLKVFGSKTTKGHKQDNQYRLRPLMPMWGRRTLVSFNNKQILVCFYAWPNPKGNWLRAAMPMWDNRSLVCFNNKQICFYTWPNPTGNWCNLRASQWIRGDIRNKILIWVLNRDIIDLKCQFQNQFHYQYTRYHARGCFKTERETRDYIIVFSKIQVEIIVKIAWKYVNNRISWLVFHRITTELKEKWTECLNAIQIHWSTVARFRLKLL
jgi:hypothetical protein